ncbi:hypothetical protein IB642_06890 [Allofrancisella guangzhouensis]|uniref:Lipoprotein n=1 Tax=Allofrancisella guangzhouensis TaxID=594679 RepID=A0A0A8E6F4_9GAMM|nr:hypothetical protein [Allofrancisella guangzhouensis]AJC49534.1 hypothetical protein SD28_02715 [Allofrancisella guangzhouensis]MBK2044743.1 hypothetical protein [Allofrancisella guangzhouensis]MBK2045857.1 hypothetical protein [Allofrancisella guangzhouensis]
MKRYFLKLKRNITIVLSLGVVLVGCVTETESQIKAQKLALLDQGFSKSRVTAHKDYGFDSTNLFSNVKDIGQKDPTEFNVRVYITNNQGCKFVYIKSKDGKLDQQVETGSFKAYLSDKNILLKASCKGKKSNIDYKIITKVNGTEYNSIGNLSYSAEAAEF